MAIKEVEIGNQCTACGLCGNICPEVFTLGNQATINNAAAISNFDDKIKEAAFWCPCKMITYQEHSL